MAVLTAGRTNSLPGDGEYGAIGKWKGNGAGRMAMVFGAASERSMAQLECDQKSGSTILADRIAKIGRVLGNSYVMAHGSYPR
jgi:hypothetical protein